MGSSEVNEQCSVVRKYCSGAASVARQCKLDSPRSYSDGDFPATKLGAGLTVALQVSTCLDGNLFENGSSDSFIEESYGSSQTVPRLTEAIRLNC